jgi:hypothetical protein
VATSCTLAVISKTSCDASVSSRDSTATVCIPPQCIRFTDASARPQTGSSKPAARRWQEAPEHPTGQPSNAAHDAVLRLRVPRQEADLLRDVAVALGRREDFDVARGFRHEVVDGVLGKRGELLWSVGGRGSGAHRAESVDGCRGATAREFGSDAKTEKESYHSIRHDAILPET